MLDNSDGSNSIMESSSGSALPSTDCLPLDATRTTLLLKSLSCLTQVVDLETLWTTVANRLKELLDFERLDLALLNQDGLSYRLQTLFETRPDTPLSREEQIPLGGGVLGWLSRRDAAYWLGNPQQERSEKAIADSWLEADSLSSLLVMQLEAHGNKLGALLLGRVSGEYQPVDIEIVKIFASHLSLVLDRFAQTRKLQQTTKELNQEITNRQQAEVALQQLSAEIEQQRQLFDIAVSSIPDFIYTFDLSGRFIYANKPLLELLQIILPEAVGKNFWDLNYPPDLATKLEQQIQTVIATRQPIKDETPFTSAFGTRSYEYIFVPRFDQDGAVVAVAGTTRDITERKHSEVALHHSQERYKTLFESIDEGFCLIEVLFDQNETPVDYRFLITNPVFQKQTGLEQAEGKTVRQLVPDIEQHWIETYGNIVLTGEPRRFKNHSEAMNRWFDVYACRIGQQSSREVAIIFKDITEAKRIEAEREQILKREQTARETAENANRIKDEFLAVLSHELRSPLNPILGWTNLLRNGRLDAQKTVYALETIERNAKLQMQLIEDLLDISRILQGKLSFQVMPVDLAEIIAAALETVKLAAEAKSLQIQTTISPTLGQVQGDAGRLQQVFWNLFSNAVKFTPKGGQITVALSQVGTDAQIQVTDTGKGIKREFLPYIFEHFQQEDSAITRKFGGLGLGLAIAKQIVEMHGGTIQADSLGESQGTTFTVRLPLRKLAVSEANEPLSNISLTSDSLPLRNVQVLVVDDDCDTCELMVFVLQQAGASVTSASSASAALDILSQFKADVLVSDIGMPDMDGYMLIKQLRAMPEGEQLLAIALTAYAGEIEQKRVLAAGFQCHLTKPIEPELLVQQIAQLSSAKGLKR